MNKLNLTNLLVGILTILLAFTTKTFLTPILFILGSLNLFIGFGGFDYITKHLNK